MVESVVANDAIHVVMGKRIPKRLEVIIRRHAEMLETDVLGELFRINHPEKT